MGLYKITTKKTGSISGGIRLEKGMSVEVIDTNNPIGHIRGKDKICRAIKNKYGLDIKPFQLHIYFESEKIN